MIALAVLTVGLSSADALAAATAPLTARYRESGQTTLVTAGNPSKAPFGWQVATPRTALDVAAPFVWQLSGVPFGGVYDSVSYLGYNTAGIGGKAVASEPLMTWNIEQYYLQGTQPTLETYWEFRNTAGDRNVRPIFLQFNRDTGNVNRFTFAGNEFGFQEQPKGRYDDPLPWLQLYPGSIDIRPSSGRPAQLQMGTPPDQGSTINMTWGGKSALRIDAIRPNHVKLTSGGGAELEFVNDDTLVSGPIVMKSPNGKRWAVTVGNDGKLTTTERP